MGFFFERAYQPLFCAKTRKANPKIRFSVDDTNSHGVLPEDRVAFLYWASSRSSLRRVQSARFTQLTSRVVDRCFRGPFEEQALRTPFSSQPDSFWFKSPLLVFRPPHQPKLLQNVAWQPECLSALVPSPDSRPFLQGFAGRLRTQYLAMVGSGPSLTLGVDFRDSESYPTLSLRLRFVTGPAFLKLLRSPSTFSAFRATFALRSALTGLPSIPRSLPLLRYSACILHSEK